MDKLESRIKELENHIKVLENENERLAENAEDILLLEQIAEKINTLEKEEEIVDFLLERVSLVKDIFFAAFGYLNDEKIEITNSFCNRSENNIFFTEITLPHDFNYSSIKNGIHYNSDKLKESGIRISLLDSDNRFNPDIFILIPIDINSNKKGFFVFADDEPNEDRIDLLLPLLKQLVDTVAGKIINKNLYSSLLELSKKLEEKVLEQTEEIRQSREKYLDLYDNAPDMMFSINPYNGEIMECNQTFANKMNLTKNEIIGRLIFDFYDEEFLPIAKKILIEFLNKGEIKNKKLKLNSPSGESFWVVLSATSIKDKDGKIIRTRSILRDITEIEKLEQEIFEQKGNFRELVENLLDGVAIADESAHHLYVNKKFTEITGYSNEELKNMTGWDYTRPEDIPILKKRMKDRLYGSLEPKIYERIILNKSGEEIPVEMSVTTTIWEGKVRPLAIIRDLREQKRKESEIKKSEEEYKALIESSPQAIWSVDKKYKYIKFNSYYRNMILAKDKIYISVGLSSLEGKEPKEAEFYEKKYNEVFNGKKVEFEIEYNISGKLLYYKNILAPIYFEENVVGVSAIAIDITQIREAEKEIAEHNKKYRLITNTIPDTVIVSKLRDGTVVDANEKFEKFSGWKLNEVIGKTYTEINVWDKIEDRDRLFEQLHTNKVVHNFYTIFRTKNGKKIHATVNATIYEINGEEYLLTISRDLTPIIEANEKAKYFLELLKKTEHLAKIGSWEYDLKTDNTIWSDNLYNLFGLPIGSPKVTSDYFLERMHLDDLIKYKKAEKEIFKNKKEVSSIFRVILEDKSIKYFENIITPIIEDGEVVKLHGVNIDITESSLAKTKLLENEAKLREASKIAKLGYWDLDIINNKLVWSDEVYRIFGTEPQSFGATYEAFLGFIHPDDRTLVNEAYTESLKTKEPYDIVHRIVQKDGTEKYVREMCSTSYDDKGNPKRSIGIVQDITKQKETEIELSMQSQYLKSIFDSIDDALFVHDAKTFKIIDVNNRMLEMYGYSREEFLNLPINEFFHNQHPYTSEEAKEWMEKSRDEGPQAFEWLIKKKDGTLFWTDVRISYAVIASEPRYLVLARDITEKKKAREKIFVANEQLKIIHKIDHAILNSEDISLVCNMAIEKLQNLLKSARVSVALFDDDKQNAVVYSKGLMEDKIGNEQIVAVQDAFPDVQQLEQGKIFAMPNLDMMYELDLVLQELRKKGIRSVLNIPILAHGKLMGSLNVGYIIPEGYTDDDINLAKEVANLIALAIVKDRLRKQLKKQMENLENEVAKRTEELTYANQELQEFAYSVSHDLKTPLRAISGFTDIVKKRIYDSLTDETLQYFDFITEATKNMEDLIRDLLVLSRLGQKDLVTKKISFLEVAEQTVETLQSKIIESNAQVFLPKENIEFNSDPTLLKQILLNLIQNGISYHCKDVKPEIRVEIETDGNELTIKVIDNGFGIDEKYHEKIFNVFQRLENSKNIPGTGIGLSIVKKAVVKLGGNISLISEVNKGTTFIINIPLY